MFEDQRCSHVASANRLVLRQYRSLARMPRSHMSAHSSRSGTPASERSAGGSRRDHEISWNSYSRINGHWGTMTSQTGADVGRLYHARSNEREDPDKFYYEDRVQDIESRGLHGRSILGRLSEGETQRAGASIRDYGSRDENIPRYSQGQNCQTFTTGVMRRLEGDGFVSSGTAAYFEQQVGRKGTEIASSLQESGRSWIPAATRRRDGPDATWGVDTNGRRPPGRLDRGALDKTFETGRRAPPEDRDRGRRA